MSPLDEPLGELCCECLGVVRNQGGPDMNAGQTDTAVGAGHSGGGAQ